MEDPTTTEEAIAEFVGTLRGSLLRPDEECIAWAHDMHEAMTPRATGGVYANFVPEEDGDQQAAYGENYDRLVEVKNRWDPENLFRLNHNVEPTESASART